MTFIIIIITLKRLKTRQVDGDDGNWKTLLRESFEREARKEPFELSFLKHHLQTEYLSSDWSFD